MDGRLRGGRDGEIRGVGDVLPVPVVNQEANGGEPKQMLTGCLVNSTLPLGTEKVKNRKTCNRKGELKKKKRVKYPFGRLVKVVGLFEV